MRSRRATKISNRKSKTFMVDIMKSIYKTIKESAKLGRYECVTFIHDYEFNSFIRTHEDISECILCCLQLKGYKCTTTTSIGMFGETLVWFHISWGLIP